jgi:hypothetical protein
VTRRTARSIRIGIVLTRRFRAPYRIRCIGALRGFAAAASIVSMSKEESAHGERSREADARSSTACAHYLRG